MNRSPDADREEPASLRPQLLHETTKGDMRLVASRGRELAELIQCHLNQPVTVEKTSLDFWKKVVGPAMMARLAGGLQTMAWIQQARHEVDAFVLLRSIFEVTATFCWMADRPELRVKQWCRECTYWDEQRWKDIHNILESVGWSLGEVLEAIGWPPEEDPPADTPDWLKTESRLPSVPEMAAEADQFWSQKYKWWIGQDAKSQSLFGLRRLYALVYRRGSGATHGLDWALGPYVSRGEGALVAVHPERSTTEWLPYGLASLVVLFAVASANLALGWPDIAEARWMLGVDQFRGIS